MRAGKRRHYVTLQRYDTSGTDAAGDPLRTWVDVDHLYVSIDPPSLSAMAGAREAVMGGAQTAVDLRVITLPPYPGVTTETWRVVDADGKVYVLKANRTTNDGSEMIFLAAVGGV